MLSGKESLRLQRPLIGEEGDEEEGGREGGEGGEGGEKELEEELEELDKSFWNNAVFGKLTWKCRFNTGSEYTLPTSGCGLYRIIEKTLTRVKQNLSLDQLLFYYISNRENLLKQINYY